MSSSRRGPPMWLSVDVLALPGSTRLSHGTGHRRCARCGKVVSRRALVCRRCGKQQRVNPRSMMLLVAGLFVIALFAVATASPRLPRFLRSRDVPTGAAPAATPAPSLGPPIATITAAELWASYSTNAAKADARWKDKPVVVTGAVVDARRDFRGKLFLRLATGDTLETVRAAVQSSVDGSLPARGQVVSLRCTGRGAAIGSPLLGDCQPL